MKATFIIELNRKHRNSLNKPELWFRDVDISVIPSVGWSYQYMDEDEPYYGEITKIEVFKNPSENKEILYIGIKEY